MASIAGIVMLLAEEARSGGLSGNLYTEHLAHALALRFLRRAGGAREVEPVRGEITPNRALRRVLARMEADLAMNLDVHHCLTAHGYKWMRRTGLNSWYVPADAAVEIGLVARWQFFRKHYLGVPFRHLREASRRVRHGTWWGGRAVDAAGEPTCRH